MKNLIQLIYSFVEKMSFNKRESLQKEYYIILDLVKHANTLGQLITFKTKIENYEQKIYKLNSPVWGKNNVRFLKAMWNKRYRVWKSKFN